MSNRIQIKKSRSLRGACQIPGDKSISHRAVMLAGIASGKSHVKNFLSGSDCLATVGIMRALGVQVEALGPNELTIIGRGLDKLEPPTVPLDCDNSGTTMRLMTGILSGQRFNSQLIGTSQLSGRPMSRIIDPLKLMGARIDSRDGKAPLVIHGCAADGPKLSGIEYPMPVASAQVKSCLMLAGLLADARTTIIEKGPSRDHTERMLQSMGAPVHIEQGRVEVEPLEDPLRPIEMTVPGDISSAAFLLVAGSIVPGSEIAIREVGINPTRSGIVEALISMGADIEMENERTIGGEPIADIKVRYANLRGATFKGDAIVKMIDELPVLAVAATQAEGKTIIRDAGELRVKETDRIATTVEELGRFGAKVTPLEDGMVIKGGASLRSAVVQSHGDHRLAMLLAVAGLVAEGETIVENAHVTSDSFPGFEETLASLGALIKKD
ncbi:MAG: 3-phosphoshikimate 1-carboxyvinyltransferase [Proteobacteria bacterium]|nr:3-phosphoshikimate 1-carboxyvinyltransferase [Pseudomonadota bacterium]